MVERGYVVPGSFVVASDSHSNMYGALGAIGTPIVRTDAAAVWATGEFWWQIPRSIQVVLEGHAAGGRDGQRRHHHAVRALQPRRSAERGGRVQRTGRGRRFRMDARFSISNMTTEWGPLVGWFPVDDGHPQISHRRAAATDGAGHRALHRREICRIGRRIRRARSGCGLCRSHRARSGAGHAACLRAGHGAGDAVAGGDGDEESCDPEGVSAFLRELAAGGSGSGRRTCCKARKSRRA